MMTPDPAASPFRDRRCWVTGASSGIGRAVAEMLLAGGARVAVSGRNEDALAEVASGAPAGQVLMLPFDVTEQGAHGAAARRIEADWGGLDVAILNAGTASYIEPGRFESAPFERLMRINFLGIVYGVEAVLPLLARSPWPRLAGMGSIAGWRGLPRSEAYGASKAAVRHLMQSLRVSQRPRGIPVTCISPGFVRTPLTDKNDFAMPGLIEPAAAARAILRGVARGKGEISFPLGFSTFCRLVGALPDALYTPLITRMLVRREGAS